MERFRRTINVVGDDGYDKLKNAEVLIIGIGGVGTYAAEAAARSGVGHITVMDGDIVDESNINRQIIALTSTVGRSKANVMKERMLDINPNAEITAIDRFFAPEDEFDFSKYDFVIDAIDSVDAKIELITKCLKQEVKIISSMGTAGKLNTENFKIADISRTNTCPLAKAIRRKLREKGIEHLPVVYSDEKPIRNSRELGTMSYIPGTAGLMMAGYVIKSIINIEEH